MSPEDFEDPAVEARWLDERLKSIRDYLGREGVKHGPIEDRPRWFRAPYVGLWFVAPPSRAAKGWWVITGDLPTDYMSAVDVEDAREAMRAFSARWERLGGEMMAGQEDPELQIGRPEDKAEQRKLGDLLLQRARILAEWAEDESLW